MPFVDRAAPTEARRKKNLCAQVVESLGKRIVRESIEPRRSFPNEADLEKEFNVSRSVIREAVKTLAAKGLLESRTRTGIRPLPSMHWNLLDPDVLAWRFQSLPPQEFFGELLEIRLMIEPEAAALAASRGNEQDVGLISAAFEAMVRAGADGRDDIEADLAFHRAILAASGNAMLLQMGNLISIGLDFIHRFSNESFSLFLDDHGDVKDAIVGRDPVAARAGMQKLLEGTRQYMATIVLSHYPAASAA